MKLKIKPLVRDMGISVVEVGLTQHFIRGEIPEEEYIYAIKSLRKTQGKLVLGGEDVAFQ